jgi:hypothetical protein
MRHRPPQSAQRLRAASQYSDNGTSAAAVAVASRAALLHHNADGQRADVSHLQVRPDTGAADRAARVTQKLLRDRRPRHVLTVVDAYRSAVAMLAQS